MITDYQIGLARHADGPRIARMSRDHIEHGLGWSWTPHRVLKSVSDEHTNVAVARDGRHLIGFGIMEFGNDEGHLVLLAVQPSHRRRGVGKALVSWLEKTALTAGIGVIYLEARLNNTAAKAFYRRLGYQQFQVVPGYYRGREACTRMAKDLWSKT